MTFIDLTVRLNEDTPVYPGDPKTKIVPAGVLENDGYADHFISIGTHVGTHIDAPAHMVAGGATLEKIPVSQFVGRGRYIKVQNKEFRLQDLEAASIQSGDIVLFHTGLAESYDKPEIYFEDYPAIPESVAKYLIDKKISMVGMDMCSPDHPDFPIHKLLLGNGILIIENLTNLGKLANIEFTVYALPLNLEVDGSPARVIAQHE